MRKAFPKDLLLNWGLKTRTFARWEVWGDSLKTHMPKHENVTECPVLGNGRTLAGLIAQGAAEVRANYKGLCEFSG